jgi:hypothetical protein
LADFAGNAGDAMPTTNANEVSLFIVHFPCQGSPRLERQLRKLYAAHGESKLSEQVWQ